MNHDESLRQLIARAAATLLAPWTVPQLVVAAWRLDPARLGLAGYTDLYPDSNKVLINFWGRRGLLGRGEVARDGAGFRLTARGRALLPVAANSAPAEPPPPILPPALRLASCSMAYAKFNEGHKDTIDFTDARYFWGADLGGKIGDRIAEIDALLADRDTPELRCIGACHDWLTGAFARKVQLVDGTTPAPDRHSGARSGTRGRKQQPLMVG